MYLRPVAGTAGLLGPGRPKSVTDFSAVPFVFDTIKRMRFSSEILDQLVCVTQAGGHLSPAVTKHFRTLLHRTTSHISPCMARLRRSPRIAYLHPHDAEAKHGSVGKPIAIGTVTLDGADPARQKVNLSITGQCLPRLCLGARRPCQRR